MGHKSVCLECYRVENLRLGLTSPHLGKCPLCLNQMVFVNHSFRPPKKTNYKKWELVKFLVLEGFPFHHVYKEGKSEYYKTESNNYVNYPKTLEEAKDWVLKYKDQRIKN